MKANPRDATLRDVHRHSGEYPCRTGVTRGSNTTGKYKCFLGVKEVKYGWTIAHDECRNNLGSGVRLIVRSIFQCSTVKSSGASGTQFRRNK